MSKKLTLKDLEQQVGELTEALQRERADAVNLRRRQEEQIGSLTTVVKAQVIQELLPAIDNLERALKHVPSSSQQSTVNSQQQKTWEDWAKGVLGIKSQFEKTLTDLGVQRIKTVGEIFDPSIHEAVGMEDGDGDHEIVSEELQPGYLLGDEVIRHAMVKVKREAK